jgi:hypothetical protein
LFVSQHRLEKKMKTRTVTRTLVLVALMLNLGVAGVYAQQMPVKMTFSGTLEVSTINLQPDTNTDGENVAGDGALGPFTFRELHADVATPQPSSTCSGPTRLYFPATIGAGVFRFQDGSLLTVRTTEGAICIDLAAGMARLSATYEITGGSRRLKGASGTLTLTATLIPVLFNASGGAVLATNTGKFEGTVFGVDIGEEGRDERQ